MILSPLDGAKWPIHDNLGNLEHDDIPTIDNSIASMSPRTFDDIPVSTVFAEEKSRESDRKSTTSLKKHHSKAKFRKI